MIIGGNSQMDWTYVMPISVVFADACACKRSSKHSHDTSETKEVMLSIDAR